LNLILTSGQETVWSLTSSCTVLACVIVSQTVTLEIVGTWYSCIGRDGSVECWSATGPTSTSLMPRTRRHRTSCHCSACVCRPMLATLMWLPLYLSMRQTSA